MGLWEQAIELLRSAIFVGAQMCDGNLGGGILLLSALVRAALFPVTLRMARAAARHQATMRRLQPELDAIRQRWRADPQRQARETQRLFAREGISLWSSVGCASLLVQAPVLFAVFSAVRGVSALGGRFLWIPSIARPDVLLACGVALLTGAAAAAAPSEAAAPRLALIVLPVVISMVALTQMASGVGLYWGVSSAGSLAQALWLRRARTASTRTAA